MLILVSPCGLEHLTSVSPDNTSAESCGCRANQGTIKATIYCLHEKTLAHQSNSRYSNFLGCIWLAQEFVNIVSQNMRSECGLLGICFCYRTQSYSIATRPLTDCCCCNQSALTLQSHKFYCWNHIKHCVCALPGS